MSGMKQPKKIVYRAGLIPYYYDSDGILRMLFARPSCAKFGGPDFQIAKGRCEDNESAEQTAVRESSEELGLVETNIVSIEQVGVFLGRTTLFIAKIKDPTLFNAPDFETAETKWFTPAEFQFSGRELHRLVVDEAVDLIKTRERALRQEAKK